MRKNEWQALNRDSFKLEDKVLIWRFRLNINDNNLNKLENLLSEDELKKAERFHFQKDRIHYVAAHGQLRIILGRYLKTAATKISFKENKYGKPFLNEDKSPSIYFNLSHSHEMALLAVSKKNEVGVDIEWMGRRVKDLDIARHFFSNRELKELEHLPNVQKTKGFFNCWTRKEAYIKARGMGLSIPLDQFDVSLSPGAEVKLLGATHDPDALGSWELKSIDPWPNYAAAVALNAPAFTVKLLDGLNTESIVNNN